MTIGTFLLAELEREVERTRAALRQAPDGRDDWKPHERSMAFGYLASLLAMMPSWIAMQISQDELDVAPVDGSQLKQEPLHTAADRLGALDRSAADARHQLTTTTEAHLGTEWRLKARGEVVQQDSRANMIQDTLNHWAHHRGQFTVYLRLMGARVPAVYGPSADDDRF